MQLRAFGSLLGRIQGYTSSGSDDDRFRLLRRTRLRRSRLRNFNARTRRRLRLFVLLLSVLSDRPSLRLRSGMLFYALHGIFVRRLFNASIRRHRARMRQRTSVRSRLGSGFGHRDGEGSRVRHGRGETSRTENRPRTGYGSLRTRTNDRLIHTRFKYRNFTDDVTVKFLGKSS